MSLNLIFGYLFHILIVGGLLIYIGLNKKKISDYLYPLISFIGVIVILYELYIIYKYIIEDKGKGYLINFIHLFIIGPILLLIGYYKSKIEKYYYEILLILGIGSIGYNTYNLIQNII